MNATQVASLQSVMDQYSLGAVQAYDACQKQGGANCDVEFENDVRQSSKGAGKARELKGMIKNFYSCVRSTKDAESCARDVRASYRARQATAPRVDASPARTALEMQASAPASGPSSSAVIAENARLAKPQYLPSEPAFDPSTLYKNLPQVNPLALIPNRDLLGRTRTDFVRNPFFRDLRPPVFAPYKARDGLPVNAERVEQLRSLRAKYKALQSGVGYSSRAYCNNLA